MRLALLAPVLLVAVVGCGGGDDSDDEPSPPVRQPQGGAETPGKSEFVAQADDICAEAKPALVRLERSAQRAAIAGDFGKLASIFDDAADETRSQVKRLRALTPPRGDEDIVDRYLTGIEEQIAVLRRMADAATREDAQAVAVQIVEGRRSAGQSRAIAQRYGFKECGNPG